MTHHVNGALYKRYILNLKDQSIKMEDIVHSKIGAIDLPTYHPKFEGVAKNRYTYLFQFMQ